MKKEKDLTIVHANKLIEASYSLKPEQLKVIALACTKINSKTDSYDSVGEIAITAKDLIAAYSIENPQNVYYHLKETVRSIMRHPIHLYSEIEKRNIELSWFTKNTYSSESLDREGNEGYVTVQFSPEITPYLFKLKNKFVKIDFEVAKNLTPTSMRFYQWFKHEMDLLEKYKHNSEKIVTVSVAIDEIKIRLKLGDSYKRYSSLKERILEPAIKEIQDKTNYSVTYKPSIVGTGRKYNTVTFTVLDETTKIKKPSKPLLPKRPRAKAGTDLESKWHIECYNALSKHRQELQNYDSEAKLNLVDMKKLLKHAEYLKYSDIAKDIQREIEERSTKKSASTQEPEQVPVPETNMISLYMVMTKDEIALSDYERELKEAYKAVPLESLKGVLVPQKKPENCAIGEVEPTDFEAQRLAAIEAGRKALEAIAPQTILSDDQQQELIESTRQAQEIDKPTNEKASVNMATEAMKKFGLRSKRK